MNTTISTTIATASIAALMILSTISIAHPAFALQHFFNCITDISNKDGGDHNLSLQQVIACFKKEFPNNPGTSHIDPNLENTIVNENHLHSQILNVP